MAGLADKMGDVDPRHGIVSQEDNHRPGRRAPDGALQQQRGRGATVTARIDDDL